MSEQLAPRPQPCDHLADIHGKQVALHPRGHCAFCGAPEGLHLMWWPFCSYVCRSGWYRQQKQAEPRVEVAR